MPRFPQVMLLAFALTLFTSATLMFLVQPMIGKMILPLLGGTPEVWNTCMVFFQAMLLAGYAYAHATTRWLGVRRQARLHLAVVLLPALLFAVVGPIAVNKSFIVGGANPIPGVLLVLLFSVGLPFFVVSTTSPLLQQWFSSTDHPSARDPYFLSTASNLGSMLALVGYPVLVEPFLPLRGQRITWAVGYGLYIVLTGTCAVLLWKSGLAREETPATDPVPVPVGGPSTGITEAKSSKTQGKPYGKGRGKKGNRAQRVPEQHPKIEAVTEPALSGEVTLSRRLRWILLAAVPSSMMMGVTTYVTTDISAIPLLWVLPLGLYLLSFILVFAKIPESIQSVLVFIGLLLILFSLVAACSNWFGDQSGVIQMIVLVLWLGGLGASFLILRVRDSQLIQKAMILVMPLLVLLLVFIMLSDIKPMIGYNIAMHLLLMFVVCMVCHGEMVRDRPTTKYLTEFYMLMSFGGVLGGIFNALIAPVIFNSLAEYTLAMVLASALLPPLIPDEEETPGKFGNYVDLTLVGLFTILGIVLIWLRIRDKGGIPFGRLNEGGWGWPLTAVLVTLGVGLWYILRTRTKREDRSLDIALPLTLLLMTIGLVWGLQSEYLKPRLATITSHLPIAEEKFRGILTFGLPAVLCYTFVERSLRFGLGVGAVLLAGAFTNLFQETSIYEHRSYFGVLKVEVTQDLILDNGEIRSPSNHRLMHGTTLHGKQHLFHQYELPQFLAGGIGTTVGQNSLCGGFSFVVALQEYDYTAQAMYYHRTGPIGQVMRAYNRSASDRIGVIGLGTGTLACYGRPGQTIVFYDIDKTVKEIAFDRRDYFTFVQDAKARGVQIADLVLGDARLEIERHLEKNPNLPEEEKYSLLAVDAFSSDAIPIHLITQQAIQLYLKTLRKDGVLAFHVSNRYLDLRPVLANIAKEEGLAIYAESDDEPRFLPLSGGQHLYIDPPTLGKSAATWVVLARREEDLSLLMTQVRWDKERKAARDTLIQLLAVPLPSVVTVDVVEMIHMLHDWPDQPSNSTVPPKKWPKGAYLDAPWQPLETNPEVGVWTDDYSNLLKVFLWQ